MTSGSPLTEPDREWDEHGLYSRVVAGIEWIVDFGPAGFTLDQAEWYDEAGWRDWIGEQGHKPWLAFSFAEEGGPDGALLGWIWAQVREKCWERVQGGAAVRV